MTHIPYHDMYSGPGESMGEKTKPMINLSKYMDKVFEEHEKAMKVKREEMNKFFDGLVWPGGENKPELYVWGEGSTQYYDEHGKIEMVRGQYNPINFNVVCDISDECKDRIETVMRKNHMPPVSGWDMGTRRDED